MKLHNKYIMLTAEMQEAIKEGKEDAIPSELLELAKEWLENLNKNTKQEDKEILENGED